MTNKRYTGLIIGIMLFGACVVGLIVRDLRAQPTPMLPALTRISDVEFMDFSKVSAIRFPVYTPACFQCQTRWGAAIVVDGSEQPYSEAAESIFRSMLGDPPKVFISNRAEGVRALGKFDFPVVWPPN